MPTTEQIADYLFKKSLGTSFTKTDEASPMGEGFKFFNEPLVSRTAVYGEQIWSKSNEIPYSAPETLTGHGQIDNVVELVSGFTLSSIPNAEHAFSGTGLIDVIPFNYGDGTSYNYQLSDSSGISISLGNRDWFVDPDAGVLIFSEGVGDLVSEDNLPVITCYRYVGKKGLGTKNLDLPQDGIYGNQGGIAGVSEGDLLEDAFDKVEVILEKLAPPKPPDIDEVNLNIEQTTYQAYKQNTFDYYDNIVASQDVSARVSEPFYDGENGALHGFYNTVLVGSATLSSLDDTGYGSYSSPDGYLEIISDEDYHSGVVGKQNFWYALDARVLYGNPQEQSSFEIKMAYLLGATTKQISVTGEIGLPISSPSNTLNSDYQINLSSRQMDGVVIATTNSVFKIKNLEAGGVIGSFYGEVLASASLNGHGSANVSKNQISSLNGTASSAAPQYGDTVGFQDFNLSINNNNNNLTSYNITSKDYRGVTITSKNFTIFPQVFLDTSTTPSNRVKSGTGGRFSSSYGGVYNNSASLKSSGNEELLFSRGYFQFPNQDFSAFLSNTENYATGMTNGLDDNYRWATFDMGNISAKTIEFNITGAQGFSVDSSKVILNVLIYVKVEGSTGWLDANSPYPGVGNPLNDGDSALVGSASSSTSRVVTFGTSNLSGKLYIKMGLKYNSTKKFQNVQLT